MRRLVTRWRIQASTSSARAAIPSPIAIELASRMTAGGPSMGRPAASVMLYPMADAMVAPMYRTIATAPRTTPAQDASFDESTVCTPVSVGISLGTRSVGF